jgi:hypothetical protein
MYKNTEQQITFSHEFFMPFGGELNPKNKWCQLVKIIPWAEVEKKYANNFKTHKGQVAYSSYNAGLAAVQQPLVMFL